MNLKRFLCYLTIFFQLAFVTGCSLVTHSPEGTETTLVLTRHGDRDKLAKNLNEKGQQRALALVKAMKNLEVGAIFVPKVKRNIDTATPLANKLGIEPVLFDRTPTLVKDVTRTLLTEYAGKRVLWVGNQDNLKGIYSLLGGEGRPPVEYGDLYIMTIKDKGDPDTIKRTYGPK